MAITFVQGNINLTASSVGSIAKAFTLSQVSGNTNYVGVTTGNSTQPTISDTNSQTYTLQSSASNSSQGIFLWLFAVASIASGSNTVTASTTVNTYMAITILEYSGVSATLDGTPTSNTGATGTAWSSASLTTTNASDLILSIGCGANGATMTAGTSPNYTMRETSTFFPANSIEDLIVTSTGSFVGAMTASSSQPWCVMLAAFKASVTVLNPSLTAGTISVSGSVSPIYTGATPSLVANIGITAASGVQPVYFFSSSGAVSITSVLAATFNPVNPNLTGTMSVTGAVVPILPTFSPSVSGNVNVTAAMIPALSLSIPGSISSRGVFTPTFSPIFVNASGSIVETGIISLGLGPITSGSVSISGGVNNIQLGPSVSGSVSVTGSVNPSLGIITTGLISVNGTAVPSLPTLVISGLGTFSTIGVINPAIDPGLGISTSGMVSVSGFVVPATTSINVTVSGTASVVGAVFTMPIFAANTSAINLTSAFTPGLAQVPLAGSIGVSGSVIATITPIFVTLSGLITVTTPSPIGKGLGMSLIGVYDFWGGGFC